MRDIFKPRFCNRFREKWPKSLTRQGMRAKVPQAYPVRYAEDTFVSITQYGQGFRDIFPKSYCKFWVKRRMRDQGLKRKHRIIMLFLSSFLILSHFLFAVEPLAIREGESAPGFSLLSVAGKEVSFSDYQNKPVVLFFWATWCPYCTAELPDLQKRYKDFMSSGIEVLAIDIGESQERVEKFLNKKNIELSVLLDRKNEVAHKYNVVGIPTYVLIDRQGKIRFHGNTLPHNYTQLLNQK